MRCEPGGRRFNDCIELKALREAPHKQLAALAFGSEDQRRRISEVEEEALKDMV